MRVRSGRQELSFSQYEDERRFNHECFTFYLNNYKKNATFALSEFFSMKRQRIYIDTSIVGGFFDRIFAIETRDLFERLKNKEVIFVLSDVLKKELLNAPQRVRDLLLQYEDDCFEHVELTKEAEFLANCYISEKVVGPTSIDDCQHIAIATINKVDVLASWNFKHIVNLTRIKGYNSVNMKMGYSILEIRNPKELIDYGND